MSNIEQYFNLDLYNKWFTQPLGIKVDEIEKRFDLVKKNVAPSLLHSFLLPGGGSDRNLSEYMSGIEPSHNSILLRGKDNNFLSLVRKEFKGQRSEKLWTPHSFDGLPAEFNCSDAGIYFVWMNGGICHRDNDMPAFCTVSRSLFLIEFCRDGKWHRDNGPSRILIKNYLAGEKQSATLDWHTNHKLVKSESCELKNLDWLK